MATYLDAKLVTGSFDQDLLNSELQKAIRETVFSSGLTVSPRRVNQIGQTIVERFAAYCKYKSSEESYALGRALALEGLGPRSVLTVTESLRRVCLASSSSLDGMFDTVGSFTNSMLEGYMHGREEQLLEIQERTHRAHLAALARLQEESGRQE